MNWSASHPSARPALHQRRFTSIALENAIDHISEQIADEELRWLFANCLPNTLDTTVHPRTDSDGQPLTYVITGDIDAMWLRDSAAQVWPYLRFMSQDQALDRLVAGVIRQQSRCIRMDPYANAFYDDPQRRSRHAHDVTDMRPGVHERKWEIDSLCYHLRLSHGYWCTTGTTSPFDDAWIETVRVIVRTFREQQRYHGPGPYRFIRPPGRAPGDYTPHEDWRPDPDDDGLGSPVCPCGLICSRFRPSDDDTTYQFLVPANWFVVVSLRQAAALVAAVEGPGDLRAQCLNLADEVEQALHAHAVIEHPCFGRMWAYEVDGKGGVNLMDDANVPNLLSLPYLGACAADDPLYRATRAFVLSSENPWFQRGRSLVGLGSPHTPGRMIWALGLTMQALTSTNDDEIRDLLAQLKRSSAGTGFMHEGIDIDDPNRFSRPWFAWANTLFGELICELAEQRPHLLAETLP